MSVGMRSVSLENLSRFDIDSLDSMSMSDTSADSTTSSQRNLLQKLGLQRQSSSISNDLSQYDPKEGVIKILRMIKQLNNAQSKKINLMTFLEMLQLQFYRNISLALIKDFMQRHKIMPKPFYLHYFIYFLHYAEYYHFTRLVVDIIDPSKKDFHAESLTNIRSQLKYIYYIINRNYSQEVSL